MFGGTGFGASTGSGFGGFGASTGSVFGQQASQPAQPAAGGFGGFGATSAAPTNTGFGGFGNTQQQQPAATGFGGASTGFGGFGQQSQAQQSTSLFGSQQPAAQPQTTGFGGFGQTANTGTTGFGGFGQTANQQPATNTGFGGFGGASTGSAFGGGGSSLFGATNIQQQPAAGGTSLFGQSSTSAFGQPAQQQTTGGFGGFGQPAQQQQQQAMAVGTKQIPYRVTVEKVNDAQGKQSITNYIPITCMPEYQHKSFEELRYEDETGTAITQPVAQAQQAQAGTQQVGGFGQPATGFGQTQQQPATTLFGQPAAAQSQSGFGSFGFGSTQPAAAQSQSSFSFGGAQPAAQTSSSLFGGGQTATAFGANTGSAFGGFGGSTGSAFGTTQSQPAQSSFSFGQPTQQPAATTNLFGGTGGFGAAASQPAASTSLFGGGFGQTQTQQPANTGFGGFGQAAAKPTTSLFGQPQSSSSLFGTGTAGSSTSSNSLFNFGSTPAASQPASSFSLGGNSGSAFGGGFGGAASQSQPSTGLFGGGSTSLFGQQPASNQTTSVGLFGTQQPPAQTQQPSLFGGFGGNTGSATTSNSLFGNTGSNLFGGQAAATTTGSNLFGTQPQTGLNQQQQPFGAATGLMGQQMQPGVAPQQQLAATIDTDPFLQAFLSASTAGAATATAGAGLYGQQRAVGLTYGQAMLGNTGLLGNSGLQSYQQPSVGSFQPSMTLASQPRPSLYSTSRLPPPTANLQATQYHHHNTYAHRQHLAAMNNNSNALVPYSSAGDNESVHSQSHSSAHSHYGALSNLAATQQRNGQSLIDLLVPRRQLANIRAPEAIRDEDVLAAMAPSNERKDNSSSLKALPPASTQKQPPVQASPQPNGTKASRQQDNDEKYYPSLSQQQQKQPYKQQATPPPQHSKQHNAVDLEQKYDVSDNKSYSRSATTPSLTRPLYYTIPSVEELADMSTDELSSLPEFIIGHEQYGRIQWGVNVDGQPVDISGVDLDHVVMFERNARTKTCSVEVYAEEQYPAPPAGQKLNRPAIISLQCWPVDYDANATESEKDRKLNKYQQKLQESTEQMGAEFLDYEKQQGIWTFAVTGFAD